MEELFEQYKNLAYSIVHKKYRYYPEREDIIQIALIGLWKASETFKPELNVGFMCYASSVICHDISDYIRNQNKHNYVDIAEDTDVGCCEIDLSSLELDILIRSLPTSDKLLIKDVVYGLKQNEMAEKYGISQTTISQRLKKIKNKLRSMD